MFAGWVTRMHRGVCVERGGDDLQRGKLRGAIRLLQRWRNNIYRKYINKLAFHVKFDISKSCFTAN